MGLRFRPQHPMDKFIADFYCHPIKLVIEVDGGIHDKPENREYDIGRTAESENYGIKVIRFKNEQILNNFDCVRKDILETCNQRKAELKVPFRGFWGRKKG
jgi:very-short-patch-repair endonuclease